MDMDKPIWPVHMALRCTENNEDTDIILTKRGATIDIIGRLMRKKIYMGVSAPKQKLVLTAKHYTRDEHVNISKNS